MKVVTVRMPDELRVQLRNLAFSRRMSMNELCVGVFQELVKQDANGGAEGKGADDPR